MFSGNYQLPEVLIPGSSLQLLNWGFAEAGPDDSTELHEHDYWQCNWGLNGVCDFYYGDKFAVLRRGDMIFIPPHLPHRLFYRTNFLSLSFKYHTNLFTVAEPLLVKSCRSSLGIIRAAEILVKTAFPRKMVGLKTGVTVDTEAHYQHVIEYLIAGTINFLMLKNNPLPEPADTLRRLLRESGGSALTVQDAADRCLLSRNHLCRKIKAAVGVSAKEFIDRERALIASEYLKFSDMNISEIADRMQFPDAGHFCKFFRRISGYTPANFRNHSKMAFSEATYLGETEI